MISFFSHVKDNDVAEDRERVLVSQVPSSELDEKSSSASNINNRNHILNIEISPKDLISCNNDFYVEQQGVEGEKIIKNFKSVVENLNFNEVDKKMSIVSRISHSNKSSGNNKNKSVTIIRHEDPTTEYEDENLSDDQKLVVLNGVVVQNVTCNAIGKSELIDLRSTRNGGGNVGRVMLSGHCSPCGGSGDSGTCSDVEANGNGLMSESPPPPPLPPKTYKLKMDSSSMKLSESTCSDASSASTSSTDSMQYHQLISPELIRSICQNDSREEEVDENLIVSPNCRSFVLPTSLLRDIRNHSIKFHNEHEHDNDEEEEEEEEEDLRSEDELNYSDIVICKNINNNDSNSIDCSSSNGICRQNNRSDNENEFYDDDKFYKFHINENFSSSVSLIDGQAMHEESDESFAGFKDLRSASSTIRSAKGTIRGVKNRVRNGIATFLQMQQTTVKVCIERILLCAKAWWETSYIYLY